NSFDLAINVEEAFPKIAEMSFCHQSQISEWLPWVGRHRFTVPANLQDWRQTLRQRLLRQNKELRIGSSHAFEVFTLTAWGEVPALERLLKDFPSVAPEFSHLSALKERLTRCRGA